MYQHTEQQKRLKAEVRAFVDTEILPVASDYERERSKLAPLFGRIGDLGFFGGGTNGEMSAVDATIVTEELARGFGSLGLSVCPHFQCCDLLSANAGAILRSEALEPALRGRSILAYAMSEQSGGSDALGIDTLAIRNGNEWVINGAKSWITNAVEAGGFIVAAKTSETSSRRSISTFYVPAGCRGLSIAEGKEMTGVHCSVRRTVNFTDCRIPLDNLLGEENAGYRLIKSSLNRGRVLLAAVAIGVARRALELAVSYSSSRGYYSRKLSDYQGISFSVAEMYANIAMTRSMLYHVAASCDSGLPYSMDAAAVKLTATEICCKVCNDAQLIHGANGLCEDFEVERCARDARMLLVAEGTPQICKIVVSNALYNSTDWKNF